MFILYVRVSEDISFPSGNGAVHVVASFVHEREVFTAAKINIFHIFQCERE